MFDGLRAGGANVAAAILCLSIPAAAEPVISAAKLADNGFVVHSVSSELQARDTRIFVRVPEKIAAGERLRVLYLLPVEADDDKRWGEARVEARRRDLANRYRAVMVYPTFSDLPWYADHANDLRIRQESYFREVVVPFVERAYPARADAAARLLLGFSKSGWGAYSLLLRHPGLFGKAAAWDAPMMMETPRYGMAPIVGTQANFERYRVATLLREQGKVLGGDKRLLLTGADFYPADTAIAHRLMQKLGIPHDYRDGPRRQHNWHGGWLDEAARWLMR
jgi:S-formylglutathione hydrolase FrmB